jgi:integrase
VVMLDKLLEVYLQNTPPNKPDYAKNAAKLRMIMGEVSGLAESALPVSEEWFNAATMRQWVRLRQEHFRLGWTVRGAAPEDAWTRLRVELKAGRLPGIDKSEVMECNTTITSYLRCAKAIFANNREYLPGLVLPELREFLSFGVDVSAPEGHRDLPAEVMAKMDKHLKKLRAESPRVWVFNQLAAWTGARPITIKGLGKSALVVSKDGAGVVSLPVTKGGKPVLWPLPADVVDVIVSVATDASLIGATHKTDAEEIHREHNEWLTKLGVEGTQKTYLFRHARLQQLREHGGVELAAAGGGHTTTAMVQKRYTEAQKAMPMLDPRQARQTA